MGGRFARTIGWFLGWKEMDVVMLGLESAGKTTILYRMRLDQAADSPPTIDFNRKGTINIRKTAFTVRDVDVNPTVGKSWHHYLEVTDALVFVVDSSDRERINQAKEVLQLLLQVADLEGVPLLVLANKQDLMGAMSQSEVSVSLRLLSLQNRRWRVQKSCALTGAGLVEGFQWLTSAVFDK